MPNSSMFCLKVSVQIKLSFEIQYCFVFTFSFGEASVPISANEGWEDTRYLVPVDTRILSWIGLQTFRVGIYFLFCC